jgi:hypothetical protein
LSAFNNMNEYRSEREQIQKQELPREACTCSFLRPCSQLASIAIDSSYHHEFFRSPGLCHLDSIETLLDCDYETFFFIRRKLLSHIQIDSSEGEEGKEKRKMEITIKWGVKICT